MHMRTAMERSVEMPLISDTARIKPSKFDRKLYIHVGPHKTGTTTIQHYLDKHADALALQKVLYPATGRGGAAQVQHWALGEAIILRNIERLNQFISEIDHELEQGEFDRVVLSTEVL